MTPLPNLCLSIETGKHKEAKLSLCAFVLQFSLSQTHTHCKSPYRQALMCPQTPLIKTNSSQLQPPTPSYRILLSFLPPPLFLHPPSFPPTWSTVAVGPTVIGLDIIYCPLGNVAFQHLIKIISSHSNGCYSLKETLCNH